MAAPHSDPSSALHAPPLEPHSVRTANDRLSLPLALRLPLSCSIGAVSGLLLGLAKGSQDAGMRFRAEHSHRLPVTQTGWFLYHKSKNYNMMLGGTLEGLKQAVRFTAWVGVYFVLEEGVDRGRAAAWRMWRRVRGGEYKKGHSLEMALMGDGESEVAEERMVLTNRDCLSSMFAGLGTAGIFSAWNRFPLPTAARTAKLGAKAGLAFGVLQDVTALMRGRKVEYIEFLKRHTVGLPDEIELERPLTSSEGTNRADS